MGKRVISRICPNCSEEAYTVDLIAGVTRNGTLLGDTLFKCRSGCTTDDLLSNEPYRAKSGLSDPFFLEVIESARNEGKRISAKDKEREFNLYTRGVIR